MPARSFAADRYRLKEKSDKLGSIMGEVNAFDEESETEEDDFDMDEYEARSERINNLRTQMQELHEVFGRLDSECNLRERYDTLT